MEGRHGLRRQHGLVDLEIPPDADDEEPWATLRDKKFCVDDHSAIAVSRFRESLGDRHEVSASVAGEGPVNVFQRDDLRTAALCDQTVHDRPEWVEGSRTFAFQSRAAAGKRQILTRE